MPQPLRRTVSKARASGVVALALAVIACACGGARPAARRVAVAAASDLQFAFDDLARAFTAQHPDITVTPTFGSSGTLHAQIASGAPFDAYFSADASYPARLADGGHAVRDTLAVYAVGHLVVWLPANSPVDVAGAGMAALADPRIRTVAIANPEHAPYGRAAVAAIEALGVADAVRPKLVMGENASQAAQFVESGAADAGILPKSLAVAPSMAAGRWWAVPESAYPRLEQAAIVTATASDPDAARAFVAFCAGAGGRAVLARHGFDAP